ncbi:MAG: hypothetical protein AABX89_08420 [Candidatus Thermoplasmatota archaeon]
MLPLRSLGLLALLSALPSAQACSLLYVPFADPTWDGALHYVDGGSLFRVDGWAETELEEGYFLSYATVGDRLLVSGQNGLGADCSGDDFLRLYEGDRLVWQRSGGSRVWPHEKGPFTKLGDDYFRLVGEELVPYKVDDRGDYILGWTHDGKPMLRDRGTMRVGDLVVDVDLSGSEPAVAHNGQTSAFLFSEDNGRGPDRAHLWVLDGDAWQVTRWTLPNDEEYAPTTLAWVDGWVGTVAGHAYRIDGEVTDLDVQGVAVTVHGDSTVVFQEDGYTVFAETLPLEARERRDGVWLPRQPNADPQEIDSEGERVPAEAGAPSTLGGLSSRASRGTPALPLGLLAGAVLLAARRR